MGQFGVERRKLTKRLSYFKFLAFYFTIMAMVVLLKYIWKWANDNQGVLTLLLFAIGVLFSLIVWGWKQYRLKHPFALREAFEDYDYYKTGGKRSKSYWFEPIEIRCLNNEWQKENFNLYLEARRKVKLKQINLRFVDKSIFKKAWNISKNMLSIKKIVFPQEKYRSLMSCIDDKEGGFDCYFDPPIECSKKNIIFFEIYPNIKISKKIKCKISLDNSSGEEKRTFSRKKVIVTNELI